MIAFSKPTPQLLGLALCFLFVVQGFGHGQAVGDTQVPNASGSYRVAGIVANKIDSQPLGRSRVVLRDTRNPQKFESVITAEDGKFSFENVPAGKYSLLGLKRAFISAFYDQHEQYSTAIVTGAGFNTENLILKLAPNAIITGKVLDEASEPVRHATVTLYSENHQEGVDRIYQVRSAQTDDLGAYEMSSLGPGTYFLSATARPWYAIHPSAEADRSEPDGRANSANTVDRSLDVAYPVTYYSDVTEADSATAIPIAGGERLQIDLHLNPAPALRLRFRLPGDTRHGFTVPSFEQSTFDGTTWIQAGDARLISPGVVEVAGVAAGHYNIRFPGQGGLQMKDVDLTKEGEEIDATAAEPLGSLKVSVQIPGETSSLTAFSVGLRSKGRIFSAVTKLDEKGQAQLDQVPAGRYEVLVWGARKPYFVGTLSAEGAEVVGHTVILKAGATPSVTLTMVAGSVEVNGIVKRAGKPFAGAMVVLVPKNPEGNRDLFRRDQSDQDGTFSLRNVVPGSYTILAIENGWDLNWSQPGVIAVYAKHGRAVEVGSAGKLLNLAEPVDVQSK